MDLTEMKPLLTELGHFEIAAFEKARLSGGPRSIVAAELAAEREKAIQDTLRDAIFRRDWDTMRAPLQSVANRLGLPLPEGPEPWAALAFETLRVLINVSEERARRDRGEYAEPSIFFSRAMRTEATVGDAPKPRTTSTVSLDTTFAVASSVTQEQPSQTVAPQTAISHETVSPEAEAAENSVDPLADNGPKIPNIRDILKSRNLLNYCSETSIASLEKGEDMTIEEAFNAYTDFKKHGCEDDWEIKQKPDTQVGANWVISSQSSIETGKKNWTDLLGNRPLRAILEEEVDDTIAVIRNLPKLHGKFEALRAKNGYAALIQRLNEQENKAMNAVERSLRRSGCENEEKIRDARIAELIPRLRVGTYVKHVRCVNRVGKMLLGLGIVKENVFKDCGFTNNEEKRLKATQDKIAREKWDDRFFEFLNTPAFLGDTKGKDDPLFWMPLIARCLGLRSEEAAQLGPGDVSHDKNIPYLRVHQINGDSVKSEAGFRKVPIHPALIDLGFMDLVDAARTNGQKRLLPAMTRGKTKKNFTENFTKSFGYYRKTNGVYWHGLDFHALRTTFHHDLMDGSCPGYIKRALMGHEALDEGEKSYAQNGISITALYEQICKVPFEAHWVKSPIKPSCLTSAPMGPNRPI